MQFALSFAPTLATIVCKGEVTTDEEAALVSARFDELWALAEARYQEAGRPLRFVGCSYYVVDSRQGSDRSVYLSEEEYQEAHRLGLLYSLYANDPYRAHLRVQDHLAELRRQREAKKSAGRQEERPCCA